MRRVVYDVLCCLAIVTIGLIIALPRFCNGIDIGDEGFLAYGAVRVMEGQTPNLNFVSLQPPLSFYSVATVFKLFGTSLITLRALGLCIYLVIPLFVYALSRHLARPTMALAAAVPSAVLGMPFFNFVPFAVWHGVLATLVAAFLFLRAMDGSRRSLAFLAGVATGLTLLSRHDQGFYLSVAICSYAVVHKLVNSKTVGKTPPGRMLSFWSLGLIALMLPMAIHWSVSGAVPEMFKQLIVFPLTVYSKTSSLPMPQFNFDRPVAANVVVGLYYLPPAVQGLTVVLLLIRLLRKRFSAREAKITYFLVLSVLFYCQVLTRSDVSHLVITLPPCFVLFAWWLETATTAAAAAIAKMAGLDAHGRSVSLAAASAVLFLASAVFFLFLTYTNPFFLRSLQGPVNKIHLDRAGVHLEAQAAASWETVTAMIQKYAPRNRSILCLPYQPMLYFLSGRRNPTRWNYLWPGDQTPQDHKDLITQAKSDPPAMVIIFDRPDLQRYARAIIDYVDSEYVCVLRSGRMTVYFPSERKRER